MENKDLEKRLSDAIWLLREAGKLISATEGEGVLWHKKLWAFHYPAHKCTQCGRNFKDGEIDPCDIPF